MSDQVSDTIKTIEKHDTQVAQESAAWSNIAASCYTKPCDTNATRRKDDALNQLVHDLVDFTMHRTLSDNHGWETVWNTVLADPSVDVNLKMAQDVAKSYNAEAQKNGSPLRLDLHIGKNAAGDTTLDIERYDINQRPTIDDFHNGAFILRYVLVSQNRKG